MKYEKAEVEVVIFENEDVVATSPACILTGNGVFCGPRAGLFSIDDYGY